MVSCSGSGMEWLSNNECGKSMAKGVFNNELLPSQSWHIWANLDKSDPRLWKIEMCESNFVKLTHWPC